MEAERHKDAKRKRRRRKRKSSSNASNASSAASATSSTTSSPAVKHSQPVSSAADVAIPAAKREAEGEGVAERDTEIAPAVEVKADVEVVPSPSTSAAKEAVVAPVVKPIAAKEETQASIAEVVPPVPVAQTEGERERVSIHDLEATAERLKGVDRLEGERERERLAQGQQ
ncbi:hypothetical protein KIPB_009099 [Kipferlia bialata]|uniref:Uncharacterized protein n=1 Tax=Kipferlia bialata TaxID=797122 RepID=A0A391NTD7_9EUKA|nr:hypothetical protein KIPB_009099 [Kipferlia bialata]|eukprot:g9099.t1